MRESFNLLLEATGAAEFVFRGAGDSLLPGFLVVQFSAPVPQCHVKAEPYAKTTRDRVHDSSSPGRLERLCKRHRLGDRYDRRESVAVVRPYAAQTGRGVRSRVEKLHACEFAPTGGVCLHGYSDMNSKLIAAFTILTVFWTSGVYSDPKPLGPLSEHKATEERGKDHGALVHRLVQIARERFEAGNLKAADKILQAALEIEPTNNEAWYYSDLVQKAIRANENRKGIRLWYPEVPPRASRQ
jgi:hypothetical protein